MLKFQLITLYSLFTLIVLKVNCIIDPISLSAIGVVVLGYYGLQTAAIGTLIAAAGTATIGGAWVLTKKALNNENLDPSSQIVLMCLNDQKEEDFVYSEGVCKRLNIKDRHKKCKTVVEEYYGGGKRFRICHVVRTSINQDLGRINTEANKNVECLVRGKLLNPREYNYLTENYRNCVQGFNKMKKDTEVDLGIN